MKLLVIIAGFVALCSGSNISAIPGDNRHYVEGESRYIWMSDGEAAPQLIDLQAPVQEDILRSKSGANNQYWLYTRQNPHSQQLITHGNPFSILVSNYLGNRPIKVIVHGWNNDGYSNMNPLITAAFLTVHDCNVIVVDWSAIANSPYTTAVAGVPSVGEHLGNFLSWLIDTAGGNWNNVHLVGFSLGAHVVGTAGRVANAWPGRITGLDPAGPGWANNNNALSRSSGQYVEAIHTDGGILGLFEAAAHADFYPNGGKNPQPGCWQNVCSHGRASELFAATVYFNHLVGRLCSNIWEAERSTCFGSALNMGNDVVSKRGNGIYGLLTRNAWPY